MLGLARNKGIWGTLLVVVALGAAGALYYRSQQARLMADPGVARRHGQAIPVRTTLVEQGKVEQVIGATATTVGSDTAVIQLASAASTSHGLIVKAVHVHEGSYVKRGQVLFELQDELFKQAVRQHEADVESASTDVDRTKETAVTNVLIRKMARTLAEAEVKFRKDDVTTRLEQRDSIAKIYEKEKTTRSHTDYFESRSKYDKSRIDLAKADRDLEKAKKDETVGPLTDKHAIAKTTAALESARGKLALAQKDLQECQVKAPVDGLVDAFSLVAGEKVKQAVSLAHVIQIDPIFVKMDFPQERLGELALGLKAEVVLDSFPGETFSGSVVRIQARVDTHARTVPVLIRVANPGHRLRPGISGFVRLRTVKVAMVVPAAAVLARDNKAVVFRVQDGRARVREVRTGPHVKAGSVEIRSGLAPGDEVVVYSNFYVDAGNLVRDNAFLQDNDPVDTNWRKWARRND